MRSDSWSHLISSTVVIVQRLVNISVLGSESLSGSCWDDRHMLLTLGSLSD